MRLKNGTSGRRVVRGLPNLIIAGVGKAGTTSMYHYLAQHEQICESDLKELNYFSQVGQNGKESRSIEPYLRHFERCKDEPYRMEASPSYCYQGVIAIDAIRRTLNQPRILISLRDPVQRFWSAYTFLQSMARLDSEISFDEYLAQCLAEDRQPTPLSVGRYIEWLPSWFDAFGADLHIVFAERLFESPEAVVNEILSWLGLNPLRKLNTTTHNPTAAPRSRLLARLAHDHKRLSNQLLASTPRLRSFVRTAYRRLNTQKLDMSMPEATRLRLIEYYAQTNKELEVLLADHGLIDVPAWLTSHR